MALSTHRLITFGGWQGQLLWEFKKGQKTNKVAVDSALSINEMAGIQYAAEAGQGIA